MGPRSSTTSEIFDGLEVAAWRLDKWVADSRLVTLLWNLGLQVGIRVPLGWDIPTTLSTENRMIKPLERKLAPDQRVQIHRFPNIQLTQLIHCSVFM